MYSGFSLPCSDSFPYSYTVQSPVCGCFPTETHATDLSVGRPDLHHPSLRVFSYATLGCFRLTVKLSTTPSLTMGSEPLTQASELWDNGMYLHSGLNHNFLLFTHYLILVESTTCQTMYCSNSGCECSLQLLLCFLRELAEITLQNAFLLQCLASDASSKCGKIDIPLF